MNRKTLVVAGLLLIATLVVAAFFAAAPTLRNASSLHYLAFAFGERQQARVSLARARDELSRALAMHNDDFLQQRLAAMDDLLTRFDRSEMAGESTRDGDGTGAALSGCADVFPDEGGIVDALESEISQMLYVANASNQPSEAALTAMPERVSTELCGVRVQELSNLAWFGEDVRFFSGRPIFSLTSGARAQELAGSTLNRFERVDRNGRSATVIAMENLSAADNVLTSARFPVRPGGDYLLGAWMRTERGMENGWFGIECRGEPGSTESVYHYLQREFSDTTWQRIEQEIQLDDEATGCALLLLNYGEPDTVYFDLVTFAEIPQE